MAAGCAQKSPILVRQAELLLSVDFQCFGMAHLEVAHPSQARRVACSHSTSWFDLIVDAPEAVPLCGTTGGGPALTRKVDTATESEKGGQFQFDHGAVGLCESLGQQL